MTRCPRCGKDDVICMSCPNCEKVETKMNHTEAIKATTEFFRRRFPEKDIVFEKACGYFGEWVKRFESDHPEGYMDTESKKVWDEMNETDCTGCSGVGCYRCNPEIREKAEKNIIAERGLCE